MYLHLINKIMSTSLIVSIYLRLLSGSIVKNRYIKDNRITGYTRIYIHTYVCDY